jgi:hypothetical protein
MMRASLIGAAAVAATGVVAPIAHADMITYTLTQANSSITEAGPYATVSVDLTSSTTATITFTAESGFALVDSNIADVNVNATSWTIASFSPTTITDTGSGNADGFGNFNQNTKEPSANVQLATVSYVLTDTSGTWASAANVLKGNASGYLAAAHVIMTDCTVTASTDCTGFAAVPGPTVGGGIPGLIAACGALFMLARRRRQQIA